MRPDPVAYTWGRPTPKLRKAPENPLKQLISGASFFLGGLYANSMPPVRWALACSLSMSGSPSGGEEGSLTGSPNSTRNCSSGPAGVLINRILPLSVPVLVKACTIVSPWNVDNRAGTGIDLALANDELELAFEDVVGFILAAVQVRRWPAFGRDLVLEDPHALALVAINLEGQKLVSKPHQLSLTLGNVDRFLGHVVLSSWLHAICSILAASSKEGPSGS